MKRIKKVSLLIGMLVVSLLIGNLNPIPAKAANKQTKKRVISIVYDNSGSMYSKSSTRWCSALYSIEVFAAMMNDGDDVRIYPMNPCVDDQGGSYDMDSPLVIKSQNDVKKIRTLHQLGPKEDTPIESIDSAAKGAMNQGASAGETWLIVITDGNAFYEDNKPLDNQTRAKLEERFTTYCSNMNILYIGIDVKAEVVPSITSSNIYVGEQTASSNLLQKLTSACNMIYGRDVLPNASKNVSFDVSMSKLLVFAQGKDIKNLSLKDSSGKAISMAKSEYSPRYSEMKESVGVNKTYVGSIDESLSGTIGEYADLSAGSYAISFDGDASSLGVYYEPDVDLVARLVDEGGNVISAGAEIRPGTYTVEYGLVDGQTGKFTSSSLLGSQSYKIDYTLNGQAESKSFDKAGKFSVELGADDNINLNTVEVRFLSDYRIVKTGRELGWADGGFKATPNPAGNLSILPNGTTSMNLSAVEETVWDNVILNYEGANLSGADLDKATFNAEVVEGSFTAKASKNGDGYSVSFAYAKDIAEIKDTSFKVKLSATYTNEDGQVATAEKLVEVTLTNDAYKFELKIVGDQDYYMKSKIDEGKPIRVYAIKDGKPFSAEEMEAMDMQITIDGVDFTVTKLSSESAYEIVLKSNPDQETGKFVVKATATTGDKYALQASDDWKFQIQIYPAWLKALVISLIILLLLLLIWLYMNMKVLPKKIDIDTAVSQLTLAGKICGGSPVVDFRGGGKKRGSLSIKSQPVAGNPLAVCGFKVELVADSPRRTPSKNRTALVTKVAAIGAGTSAITIGARTFNKDPKTGKLIDSMAPTAAATSKDSKKKDTGFKLVRNGTCSVMAKADNPRGGSSKMIMSVKLKNK